MAADCNEDTTQWKSVKNFTSMFKKKKLRRRMINKCNVGKTASFHDPGDGLYCLCINFLLSVPYSFLSCVNRGTKSECHVLYDQAYFLRTYFFYNLRCLWCCFRAGYEKVIRTRLASSLGFCRRFWWIFFRHRTWWTKWLPSSCRVSSRTRNWWLTWCFG